MNRAEIEKKIEPIIRKCLRELSKYTVDVVSDEDFARQTEGLFRPDVRRVSLLISMAQSLLDPSVAGEGLEVGSGHGYLLFPMALFFPRVRWSAVDHPARYYARSEDYLRSLREHNCQFATLDILREPLPFRDAHFLLLTFSEVLEHLPPERVNFVLSELARVVRPGGLLLMSSPNQASLENRLRLLKGKSILEMPDQIEYVDGLFGHIRLYTTFEVERAMSRLGFSLERCQMESNNSGFRGTPGSWRRRMHRLYEGLEERLPFLSPMGDTWHMAFRKRAA